MHRVQSQMKAIKLLNFSTAFCGGITPGKGKVGLKVVKGGRKDSRVGGTYSS